MDFHEVIFSKAFARVHGKDYNRFSYELRESRDYRYKIFYEIVLDENTKWEDVRDRIFPLWIRFLKNKSINPEEATGVVVSLFYRDHFYLLEGKAFIKAFCEMEGLNSSSFHFRVLKWLS